MLPLTVKLFTVEFPATNNLLFKDISLLLITVLLNIVVPSTYKLPINDASLPTNKRLFKDTSLLTKSRLYPTISP